MILHIVAIHLFVAYLFVACVCCIIWLVRYWWSYLAINVNALHQFVYQVLKWGKFSFVHQNHASLMNNILQQWNLRNWCTKAHRQVIHINDYYIEPIFMLCHSTLIYINEWKSLLAKLKVLFFLFRWGGGGGCQLTNDEVGLCFCYAHYIKLHMSWVTSISFIRLGIYIRLCIQMSAH